MLRNPSNLGFGAACNRGAAVVETPFALFLNPDAWLSPGSLAALVGQLYTDPGIAAAGPLLRLHGQIPLPRQSALLDVDDPPTFTTLPRQTRDVGFLSGAALLVRMTAFRALDGFDEHIFLYLEDDDLCFRLRQAGHRLRLVPAAVVDHDQVASARRLCQRNRHTLQSMHYLAGKHGVDFDFTAKRRQAWRRLALALLLADRRRLQVNLGRLQGLGALPFGAGARR